MKKKESSQEKELIEIIEQFERMKKDGKISYLDAEQYEMIAEYYIDKDNIDDAFQAVRMGLNIHQSNCNLLAILVSLYLEEGDTDEARDVLYQIIDREDCPFYMKLVQVDLLIFDGEENKALQLIESFSQLTNIDEVDYLEIANLCHEIGFLDKAQEWYLKCLDADPEDEEAVLGYCENAQESGQYEETIIWYNKLLDKNPYNAAMWTGLAKSYFYMGNMEKTIEAADFALVSDSNCAETHIYKAHALYQIENFPEAIKAYKEAWKISDQDVEYLFLFISFCYVGMTLWDKAHKYNKRALQHIKTNSPLFPDAMLNDARCLCNLQRYKEAHEALTQIKEHYPRYVTAYLYEARCYFEQANKEMATKMFEEAVEIAPDADTWYQIGIIANDYEESKLAANAFKQVSKLNPNFKFPENGIYKPIGDVFSFEGIMKIKELIEGANGTWGQELKEFDIDTYVSKAIEEGNNPKMVEKYRLALEQMNQAIRKFNNEGENKIEK